jgi:hypothetical protein
MSWTDHYRWCAHGVLTGPPMRFAAFNSTVVSALMALTTGLAAGLALPDDAGRRELIGLATASQIAVPAVWVGISLAFGAPAGDGAPLVQRGLSLLLNIVVIIAAGRSPPRRSTCRERPCTVIDNLCLWRLGDTRHS